MLELVTEHRCFGGLQQFYRHQSSVIGLPMRFSVYLPPQAEHRKVPVLWYLAGLSCNEETFMIKAGAQRYAAELGLALVCPDTGPRGAQIAGETESWDFGLAASFYLDAVVAPWSQYYRMETYLVDELYPLLLAELPLQAEAVGICGHSMGGHGALSLALRHPDCFQSVSALAPIVALSQCPWGVKALSGYLGDQPSRWLAQDACQLMRQRQRPFPAGILIDQGLNDPFLVSQLQPELFEQACREAQQPLQLRRHWGYDHGYYFVASFIAEHLEFHARQLDGGGLK